MSRFAKIKQEKIEVSDIGSTYKLGHHDEIKYAYKAKRGLSENVVRNLSAMKKEPSWMKESRLKALSIYSKMPIPSWGGDIGEIKFDDIYYYLKPVEKAGRTWEEVPDAIKKTFDKIGVPEAEKELLAGVKAQYDSEVIYGSLKKSLAAKGVVFLGMDEGLKQYPDLVKQYFGTVIPLADNKLAALNSAVWSGGSFIYVPKGVEVELPLQAYFRINAENAGQFERTLIIADEGSKMHYVEGCSAPTYSSGSLHSAVVEIIVKKGARVQYTTVQNWYKNVYNLVTKRAWVEEEGEMRWIDGNLGCLTGDSLVSSPDGYQRIDQFKRGDSIYTLDLNSQKFVTSKITAWKKTGIKTVYKLLTDDYREVRATDNHPFLKIEKKIGFPIYEMAWTRLGQLKEGDLIAVQSALPDDGKAKTIDFHLKGRLINVPVEIKSTNENLMWLLGAYLGDGCMEIDRDTKKGRRICLAIPKNDKAYPRLEKVLAEMGLNHSQTKNGVTVRINSTYLAELLRHLGVVGTAKTKRIPDWVYRLSLNQKLAFIEGYLDTDGHVRKRMTKNGRQYGQLVFACASEELLKQMKLLMISCGLEPRKITTYVSERKLYKGKLKEYKSCYMSMNLDVNLNIIRDKLTPSKFFRFVKVREISKLNKEAVYDIEVAGNHNFIANGILVHNSRLTMKYPACVLAGRKARGETLSIAFAGEGQHQDAGAKMTHLAPETTSQIISKSISKGGGRASYRGLVKINKGAKGARSKVVCDALILDPDSRSDTYPTNLIMESDSTLEHEATVSKVGEEQLFYLMSRGLPEHEAEAMIVNGFLEPIMKQIPLEYSIEMNRLIELEMEGSVG